MTASDTKTVTIRANLGAILGTVTFGWWQHSWLAGIAFGMLLSVLYDIFYAVSRSDE